MKTLANNYRRFGLLLLALASLLIPTMQENKSRLSATVQAAGEALQWVQPNSTGTAPAALVQHAMVYLPKWDKALLYGGTTPTGISGEVYALTGLNHNALEWKRIQPAGMPPQPRWGAGASYDAGSDRLIVFGGALGGSAPCTNETWVLKDASGMTRTPTWRKLPTRGEAPAPRFLHAQVYDEANHRLLVWGGNSCFQPMFDDLFVLLNADATTGMPTWKRLDTAGEGPNGRRSLAAAYDARNNRMILFGGSGGQAFNDVFVLANANGLGGAPTWSKLTPDGTPPEPRGDHRAVYDAATNSLLVFGGHDATALDNRVWSLSNANGLDEAQWSVLMVNGTVPETRNGFGMVIDPVTRNIIVMGGVNVGTGKSLNDVQVLRPLGYKLFGLNFSPYKDGQNPNHLVFIPKAQIQERMQIVAPHTRWVRTFGCTSGLEEAGKVAHELGRFIAMGAWIGDDLDANEREIANLIRAAQAGEVDMAIVDSEVLLRRQRFGGKITGEQLLDYIRRVREAIPAHIPVTTGEVYGLLSQGGSFLDAVDIVFGNIYPFWEYTPIDDALCATKGSYAALKESAKNKRVWISEAGWPSAGSANGEAVPSLANANQYFLDFTSWCRRENVNSFYFAAFSENWKTGEGTVSPHWGVWDSQGILKPGMRRVFEGEMVADRCDAVLCGTAAPAINVDLASVPPIGSFGSIKGSACGVTAKDYMIVAYCFFRNSGGKPSYLVVYKP